MNRHNMWGPILLAPALLLLIFLYILPIFYAMRLGLYDVGFARDTWVGLQNYRNLMLEGGYWDALRVSAKFLIATLFLTLFIAYALGLILASLSDRFCGALLTTYHIPVLFSGMVTLTTWRWFFRYPDGALNGILGRLHLPRISWLGSPTTAPWAICLVLMPLILSGAIILYVVAINQINPDLIEAARIDGANEFEVIWHIITPLTHRTRLYLFLVNTIGALQIWEHPFFYTSGGPLGSTSTVMYKIYDKAFIEGDMGMGSAMTTVTVLCLVGMAVFIVRYFKEFLG